MAGFCRILREEQDPQVKEHMLDYLIALMEDANDFSWDVARASHAVLLCRMEQGEVKNDTETEKLDRMRRANAQRHVANVARKPQIFKRKPKVKYSLAHTTTRELVSIKNHMTQRCHLQAHLCLLFSTIWQNIFTFGTKLYE